MKYKIFSSRVQLYITYIFRSVYKERGKYMKIECTVQELIELIENKKETPVIFTTGVSSIKADKTIPCDRLKNQLFGQQI